MAPKKTKAIYHWILHNEGESGEWKLTPNQEDFLNYLLDNDFFRADLECYFSREEERE